jgi:hypothetical protein
MSCEKKLAGNFSRPCGYKPKQGIVAKWYGNIEDIDRAGCTVTNKGTKVTVLTLKAGAKIYPADTFENAHGYEHSLTIGDFGNGYIHTDMINVAYRGEDERQRIQEMVEGAKLFTIMKNVDTGVAGELTFEIAGFESGMRITEDVLSKKADGGVAKLKLATREGEEEATAEKLFLMAGGVAATETWIEANSYVPSVPNAPAS